MFEVHTPISIIPMVTPDKFMVLVSHKHQPFLSHNLFYL